MQTGPRFRARYDALVVGARAAGAATAMLLARAGLSVLAVDRPARGRHALSTHALMRGAVLQLHRWGLRARGGGDAAHPVGDLPLRRGRHPDSHQAARRDRPLYAPRRTVLDPLLVRAAAAAGAKSFTALPLSTSSATRAAGSRAPCSPARTEAPPASRRTS